ncbi:MAG: DinB superfamily protein [Chlorobi bacterium OLB5]|nr:MAG: DinB superfamily protein [Chlorobi bacterium OLB5]
MNFSIERSLEILSRTPDSLEVLLSGLNDVWISNNEGPDTWSPYDIVGHLVHGEKTDWMERTDIILNRKDKHFRPFDRFAQFTESKGKTLNDLLKEFKQLRMNNIKTLKSLNLNEEKLNLKGIHPKFGEVTLKQLLSTWTIHDLNHISQICRVMAKQYKEAAGPWIEYLPILNK